MICGYNNIYDLCLNKYKYEYNNIISNGFYSVVDSYETSSVIRTDTANGNKYLLKQSDTSSIDLCDVTDETEIISSWDCYQIYRNLKLNEISLPNIEKYKKSQKDIIENTYNKLLSNGILVRIENFIVASSPAGNISGGASGSNPATETLGEYVIRLPAHSKDQINFANIMGFASIIYLTNDNTQLPFIVDYYNKGHKFSYNNMIKILNVYFNTLKQYKEIKDDLLVNIEKADTIDSIISNVFYTTKPTFGSTSNTLVDYSLS